MAFSTALDSLGRLHGIAHYYALVYRAFEVFLQGTLHSACLFDIRKAQPTHGTVLVSVPSTAKEPVEPSPASDTTVVTDSRGPFWKLRCTPVLDRSTCAGATLARETFCFLFLLDPTAIHKAVSVLRGYIVDETTLKALRIKR